MKGFYTASLLALAGITWAADSTDVVLVASPVKVQNTTYKAKNFYGLLGMKGFSDKMLMQHFELYQGYVANTNVYHDKLAQLIDANLTKTPEYVALKKAFAFEFDGMKLHEYYFENLGGKGILNTSTNLYKKIVADFGSYEKWKADFMSTGLVRGIGWVIAYYDPIENKIINTWIESHEKGLLAQAIPLLVMDCWEHAYLTDYGIKRADYIEAFMQNIQWNIVSNRFDLGTK
jgi:Fe-Mn family superoxide dismutase